MRIHVIEISTESFHLLQQRAPRLVEWTEQKPGPTQKILLNDKAYTAFIDRAIARRQTLDQVIREFCTPPPSPIFAEVRGSHGNRLKRV